MTVHFLSQIVTHVSIMNIFGNHNIVFYNLNVSSIMVNSDPCNATSWNGFISPPQSNVAHDQHKHNIGNHPSFSPIQHGTKASSLDN